MLPAGQEGRLYAADGIAEAARLAGVRVQTIKLATFVVSGGTAALGGILAYRRRHRRLVTPADGLAALVTLRFGRRASRARPWGACCRMKPNR